MAGTVASAGIAAIGAAVIVAAAGMGAASVVAQRVAGAADAAALAAADAASGAVLGAPMQRRREHSYRNGAVCAHQRDGCDKLADARSRIPERVRLRGWRLCRPGVSYRGVEC